ncbi:MAG: ATP-binding protein [Arcicella sp.]|nr:ATP-binding protein [Arcicella sp.]
MAKIIGRKDEIALLRQIQQSDRSAFVAVYGRRRVGKTYLIRSFFEEKFTFQLTGIANVETEQQLTNLHSALIRNFPEFEDNPMAKDWFQAFQQIITAIESLSDSEKKVLFIDELPWLDTPNSMFIPALEHFWNSWASTRNDIILVVCGSAASWMINELINNTRGLYNRVTHPIQIEPFTLAECEAFFQVNSPGYDRYQLIQLYMVFGGIPFYLDFIDTRKSATQNINDLCFSPKGRLRNEFQKLYASLFKKPNKHIAIIEALAQKTKGLERDELLKTSKLSNGGTTTAILRELEESSFIRKYNTFGKSKNNAIYQLTDFYSLFYLKFIKKTSVFDDDFWINGIDTPEIRAWSGYAFEQVCMFHTPQIKRALGIAQVQTQTSAWLGGDEQNKVQIDLIIDRRDQVINLCEIKFSINSFTIDKEYADSLRRKMGVFRDTTKTSKAIWLTFITTHGLTQNSYSQSLVHQSLTMDCLFG